MILELLLLIIGLSASYIFVRYIYPNQTLIKLIHSSVTIFMCLLILLGYILDYFSLPLISKYTLIFFILMGGTILIKNKANLYQKVTINEKYDIFGFIFIFIVGFISYIFTILPSLLPLSRNVDSAAHFAMVKFIVENNMLMLHNVPDSFIVPNNYPFGFHLSAALISKIFNIDPIYIIYPFVASIAVLAACVLYGIVVESKISTRFFGLVPAFIVLSFFMPIYMLRVMGWWSMIFGIFLTLMFIWLSMDYLEDSRLSKLLPLIIIEIGIIFSYTFFALIPPLTLFFAAIATSNLTRKDFLKHFVLFGVVVGAFTIDYIATIITFGENVLGVSENPIGSFVRFLPFDFFGWRIKEANPFLFNILNGIITLYFSIGVIGALNSIINKKYNLLTAFSVATFIQTILLGLGILFFGSRVYLYSKIYYLLLYPITIFLWIFLKDISMKWKICHTIKMTAKFKSVFLIILISGVLLSNYGMSIGIQATGHQELAITPDQYDVSIWVKDNLQTESIICLGGKPETLWFYAISNQTALSTENTHGFSDEILPLKFKEWQSSAAKGDVVVILDTDKIDSELDAFEVMYKKGNAVVLKNN